MKLRLLDLFSGIGGFSLGLERSGLCETVAFCEIEDFPRRVLAKHWPKVPCYHDVRDLTAERLAADGIGVDVICGGFPCQDISFAGNGLGLEGSRSGLFYEVIRIVGDVRPGFVILENVGALLHRGLGDVLAALASLRYNVEWESIPAAAVGLPHERQRVWLLAYTDEVRRKASTGVQGFLTGQALHWTPGQQMEPWRARSGGIRWIPNGVVCAVADGLSANMDGIGAAGNAVVPQIPELIGRAILAALNSDNQHGLAISTPILRADAGKNACSASHGVKLAPARICVASKEQDSAPPVSNNPRPLIDGLPCAIPPGANLAGGGISNRSQPLSFQSGDHFPNEFASSFPSQMSSLPRGVKP
ncbi:MAG: DNA cytosine methyltransferase [Alphaproteobacteria bacterium PA1]|nr:MAG: DNA cytosine methyltransferase [Alphaproteobacteria bacterium PA1]